MDPDPGIYLNAILLLDSIVFSPGLIWQFCLFFLLISISFIVSGAEVAFFSLSKPEIEAFKEKNTPNAFRVWRLISQPKKLLATILITNNFVNIAAVLVAANLLNTFAKAFEWSSTVHFLINIFLITSILLMFGEIIPKVYASKNRLKIVWLLAFPLELLKRFCSPLAYVLIEGTRFIDKRVQLKEESTSLEALKHAIDLTTDKEADKEEKEILKGIVNFGNIPVKSIMRARVDVKAVELNIPFEDLTEVIREFGFSRIPVYEDNLDNVKGVLHIKDLLPYLKEDSSKMQLKQLIRKVHFIPESKKIDVLLEEFKSRHLHLAVVVDEFGGTAGIVTLEDVIEEIFGEINDEFDSEDWVYTKKSDDTYIFEGRISLNDVKKIIGLEDSIFEDARGDSDSLGGLILELHGKIPTPGEVIHYQNFELHVESVSKNRIAMVKFVIKENQYDA